MGLLIINHSNKMKKAIITFSTFLLMLCASLNVQGQINRTLETKVADILAQLPTKELKHSDKLMEEIIGLGAEGILQFTNMLVPLGTGDDTKARYAIQSLAIYSGGKQGKITGGVVEQALLKALKNTSNDEVKTFLIDRLIYCGSNASVVLVSSYLQDDVVYAPALSVLTTIGTLEAAKAIMDVTKSAGTTEQPAFVEALGRLQYAPSIALLEQLADSGSKAVSKQALAALAEIASVNSKSVLISAVKKSNFDLDTSNSIIALIRYGQRLKEEGKRALSIEIGNLLLDNCSSEEQLHFRFAGVQMLRDAQGSAAINMMLKEAKHQNTKYVASVLEAASNNLTQAEVVKWVKAYKKASVDTKPLLIRMLGERSEALVYEKCILMAVKDTNETVRIAGIKALTSRDKNKALSVLFQSLKQASSPQEYTAIQETLLKIVDSKDAQLLADKLNGANDNGKRVLINVLAARNATSQFSAIEGLVNTTNTDLKGAIYAAMPSVASIDKLPQLLGFLSETNNAGDLVNIQKAIIKVLNADEGLNTTKIYQAYQSFSDKSKLVPILSAISSNTALKLVSEQLSSGNTEEKISALDALANWKNNDALPLLFQTAKTASTGEVRSKAYTQYLSKAGESDFPSAQKLLLVRKLVPYSTTVQENKQIIMAAGKIKTFLSLVFVSEFLDNKDLLITASNAAIQIALPTPGVQNGLSGDAVRDIVSKSVDNLTGTDSQYIKIDVKEFLDNMPSIKGFVSIFNGKDLEGWEGLLENPIARGKMSRRALAKAQEKANAQMMRDWFVKDGVIGFKGEGYNNICTIKDYGDFEMLVDWKITKGGDSGIYLRGTPQVQIWDTALIEEGAQVGSGGLYNNQKNVSIPLVVADNLIDEWNTFQIKMVGERVTVHLNGVLVTDNVVLENYWDRENPIFSKEAIELQAHGEDLGFRNVYVREIPSGDVLLSQEERDTGFISLFNGKDLDHWVGNKTDYLAENNELVVRPKRGGHGNLYTAEEYSDFTFRFDFKLTPGANNGLGIHAPLEGDVAYVGKELQILDNTASIYANLKPYQYHGSVYGIIASKRGYLNPVGEWNSQEVVVNGDNIKITLNGTVIMDGNIKEASKNGTADHTDHPGLKRNKGHIAFLGHGSELEFRNIRIKNLNK
ncbi:protein of unknown function [Maribacter arcticus]|uniref:3-keto-alpha-glucoside-1,2-lyase/3-keto-2-hydroxy-glucal hydratase domain-containing protein n=2 Tax=Maribacter arcticus TaxID=561365 RepID=A0A1T4ZQM6_9FLAO|nr:protein of unknown function [Maribacter arcticus]